MKREALTTMREEKNANNYFGNEIIKNHSLTKQEQKVNSNENF
jgi:hypothetical protein